MTKNINNDIIIFVKDIFLFLLIILLCLLPIFKQITPLHDFFSSTDYLVLNMLGLYGIFFLGLKICTKYNNIEKDKRKQYLKDLLPIFILFLYMIWTLISAIFAENKIDAFYGTEYRKEGLITYVAYAGCFGLAFCINSPKIKKILLNLFSIIIIFSTVLTRTCK